MQYSARCITNRAADVCGRLSQSRRKIATRPEETLGTHSNFINRENPNISNDGGRRTKVSGLMYTEPLMAAPEQARERSATHARAVDYLRRRRTRFRI